MFEIVFHETVDIDFKLFADQFLKSLDVKNSSRYTYKRQIKEFLCWQSTSSNNKPSREDILNYKEYLHNEKKLSSLTVAGYLTSVRKFFDWLELNKIYPNIAKGIKNPKRKKGFRKDALSAAQVKELLQSIDISKIIGLRDFAILNLMVRTGLRTIEIIRINKEDITNQSGSTVLWIQGKGRDSKDEMVLLTETALEPIKNYLKIRGKIREEDPVFVSHGIKNKGNRLTTRSISRIVKNRLKVIGIYDERITAHSMRHTAITLSLLAGATVQEARTMARHADINTTMIYAHNINRIEQAPERKIDSLLEDLKKLF